MKFFEFFFLFTASNAITTTTSATAQPPPSLNFAFGVVKEAPKTSGISVPETEKPSETTASGFKAPEEPANPSVAKTLDFSFGAASTVSGKCYTNCRKS